MTYWSDLYGEEWGDPLTGPSFLEKLANERIFSWHPTTGSDRKFRDYVAALTEGFGEMLEVIHETENAFALADAVGAQLDIIGKWVGLGREGALDARYRTLLEIQIELLISAGPDADRWAGTGESVLTITRKFIGPTAAAIVLTNLEPKDFKLSVPGSLVIGEMDKLARFLTHAVWSEVLGHMLAAMDTDYWAWDSATAGPAITGAGVWGSATAGAPIAGTLIWGTDILIGA